jgi:hypothetical protein
MLKELQSQVAGAPATLNKLALIPYCSQSLTERLIAWPTNLEQLRISLRPWITDKVSVKGILPDGIETHIVHSCYSLAGHYNGTRKLCNGRRHLSSKSSARSSISSLIQRFDS